MISGVYTAQERISTLLDRDYHEKERQRQQAYIDHECYVLLDGKIIYRKETYRGPFEKTITDWSDTARHQICQVDDSGSIRNLL